MSCQPFTDDLTQRPKFRIEAIFGKAGRQAGRSFSESKSVEPPCSQSASALSNWAWGVDGAKSIPPRGFAPKLTNTSFGSFLPSFVPSGQASHPALPSSLLDSNSLRSQFLLFLSFSMLLSGDSFCPRAVCSRTIGFALEEKEGGSEVSGSFGA